MQVDSLDTTSFGSSGAKENIAGLKGGKLSASGPYNNAAMALTVGNSYASTFGMNSTVSLTATIRITSVKVSTDVTKPIMVNISGETTGTFTAAIA